MTRNVGWCQARPSIQLARIVSVVSTLTYGKAQSSAQCPPTTGINFPTGHSAAIRIAGGLSRGALEMSFDGQNWDAVCDDMFTDNNNAVTAVCLQLGFDGGKYSHFSTTHGSNSFAADDIQCPPGSTSLSQCTMGDPYSHNCADTETVGIDCGSSHGCTQNWGYSMQDS